MSGPLGTGAPAGGPGWAWRVRVSIRRAYGGRLASVRHPLPGPVVAGITAAVAVTCWSSERRVPSATTLLVAGQIAVVAAVGGRGEPWRWRVALVMLVVTGASAVRAEAAWDGLQARQLGAYQG